ncbi:hypothetical protein V2J09_023137 [Rumex salicifolius]
MEEVTISRTKSVVDPTSITFAPVEKPVLASPENEAISNVSPYPSSRNEEKEMKQDQMCLAETSKIPDHMGPTNGRSGTASLSPISAMAYLCHSNARG